MTLKNEIEAIWDYLTPQNAIGNPSTKPTGIAGRSPITGRGRMQTDNSDSTASTNNINRMPISFNKPNETDFSFGELFSTPGNTSIQTGRAGMQNNARIERGLLDTKVAAPSSITQSPIKEEGPAGRTKQPINLSGMPSRLTASHANSIGSRLRGIEQPISKPTTAGTNNVPTPKIDPNAQRLMDLTGGEYRPELGGVVFNPKDDDDRDKIMLAVSESGIPFKMAQAPDGRSFISISDKKNTIPQADRQPQDATSPSYTSARSPLPVSPSYKDSIPTSGLLHAKTPVDFGSRDYVPDLTEIRGMEMTTTDFGAGLAYDEHGNLVPGASPNRIQRWDEKNRKVYDSDDFAAKLYAGGQGHARVMETEASKNQAELDKQAMIGRSNLAVQKEANKKPVKGSTPSEQKTKFEAAIQKAGDDAVKNAIAAGGIDDGVKPEDRRRMLESIYNEGAHAEKARRRGFIRKTLPDGRMAYYDPRTNELTDKQGNHLGYGK